MNYRISLLICLLINVIAFGSIELVRDGKANSVIIVPDNALPVVNYAAQELQYHIKAASGAELPIAIEDQEMAVASVRIYLGLCKAAKKAGISTQNFPANAFVIKTSGADLFIAGRDSEGEVLGMLHSNYTKVGTLFGVYDFLDEQMGVRWLWPGKLGEVIPAKSTIVVSDINSVQIPKLINKRIRDSGSYGTRDEQSWASAQVAKEYLHAQSVWLRRQGFALGKIINSGHAFANYWNRFGKTHPEFFNMLPNGKREPDPYFYSGSPSLVSMCVSQPNLWKQIVEDWKANRTAENPMLNCCENDTFGKCTCPSCMAWDEVSGERDDRLDRARRVFEQGDKEWRRELGQLGDRYAKFYLAVQKEAQKFDPDVMVVGQSYANIAAPSHTKLNKRILISFCPPVMFPWTEKTRKLFFREIWEGWANAGVSIYLRPNYMLDGHNMPIFFAHKFAEDFGFAFARGMIGTDFDSLTGQWSTQGPNLYVMARMQTHGDWSAEKILDEYYKGFGPAEEAVREYFKHWQKVSDGVNDDFLEGVKEKGIEGGAWSSFYRTADLIFTPKVMAHGFAILKKAREQSRNDSLARQRVLFLEKGLKNAELTLTVQTAFRKYKQTNSSEEYIKALYDLGAYRKTVEGDYICNMAYLVWAENRTWSHSLVTLLTDSNQELQSNWKFKWDPNDAGVSEHWYAEDFDSSGWFDIKVTMPWEDNEVGKQWKTINKKDYDGSAWYRTIFEVNPENKKAYMGIIFGGVDEACKVWLNGKLVLDRPFPFKGNRDSWREPFEVDITRYICLDKPNTLAVLVHDSGGKGGIHKSVWLIGCGSAGDKNKK